MPLPTRFQSDFQFQVEVGFKSRAFEPHPRFSRYDDSLFMLAILSVHTSSCCTAKRPLKKNEYLPASLDIEGKKRAMGNRKPCIAHKNKVVAYIGEFRSRTQAEPQAGWGFDSFARMTSAMDCAEFPVGQVPSFIFQFQISRSIPSTAIAMRRGPFAGLPSLLLQGSRRALQC